MVLKVCVHEWLSGGVSPCQGEGRGFESRLVLSMIQKRRYPLDTSFFVCSSPAGLERFESLRSAAVVAVERPPDVLRRLVLSMIQKRDIRWMSFFVCSSPAGLERFECLRSAPVVAGERPPDVLRRLS